MPFLTEEIWHHLSERGERESIMVSLYGDVNFSDEDNRRTERMELALQTVSEIRAVRASKGISPREVLTLAVKADENYPAELASVIAKLANVEITEGSAEGTAVPFIVKTTEYFVMLAEESIDIEAEREKLEKDLKYYEGFLVSVSKKLSNEKFVANAPEKVLQNEYAKRDDATSKIASIKKQLESLC